VLFFRPAPTSGGGDFCSKSVPLKMTDRRSAGRFDRTRPTVFKICFQIQVAPLHRGWLLDVAFAFAEPEVDYVAGRCSLKLVETSVESNWFQRLNL
jgi:hypothetical protein